MGKIQEMNLLKFPFKEQCTYNCAQKPAMTTNRAEVRFLEDSEREASLT